MDTNDKEELWGLDGCKSGWIGCTARHHQLYFQHFTSIFDSALKKACLVVVDMPVLLPNSLDDYPRRCDIRAKKKLGRYHSSIFYAPLLDWLEKPLDPINHVCSKAKKPKLSIQSFNLFTKIKEVQTGLNRHLPLKEGHPELFFRENSTETLSSKKSTLGFDQRLQILIKNCSPYNLTIDPATLHKNHLLNRHDDARFLPDDLLDAAAMYLVALSILSKTNQSLDDSIYY